MSSLEDFQLIHSSFIILYVWKPQWQLMLVSAMKICRRHTHTHTDAGAWLSLWESHGFGNGGWSNESCRDGSRRNVSTLGDKRAGMERAISNVIRVLRLHQVCVCMCMRWRLSAGPGILLFEKWGSPWRPPMSYLRLITHGAFCPLRACTHK